MALTIWDQELGATRDATQQDIDIMQAKINAYGKLCQDFREGSELLLVTIDGIIRRAEASQELSRDL